MLQSDLDLQIAVLRYQVKQKRADYQELLAWRAVEPELEKAQRTIENLECELELLLNQLAGEQRFYLA